MFSVMLKKFYVIKMNLIAVLVNLGVMAFNIGSKQYGNIIANLTVIWLVGFVYRLLEGELNEK